MEVVLTTVIDQEHKKERGFKAATEYAARITTVLSNMMLYPATRGSSMQFPSCINTQIMLRLSCLKTL